MKFYDNLSHSCFFLLTLIAVCAYVTYVQCDKIMLKANKVNQVDKNVNVENKSNMKRHRRAMLSDNDRRYHLNEHNHFQRLETLGDIRSLKSNKVTLLSKPLHYWRVRGASARDRREIPSDSEMERYVGVHNALRRLEQASNMNILTWNADLAEMASLWAETCMWEHGQPESYESPPYDPIGQNLYVTTGSADIEGAVQDWYDEINYYNFGDNTCSDVCGHYTQVVWDVTDEIGCAAATCDSMEGLNGFNNAWYLVCNYGPAGNYPRSPYTEGERCTQCSSGAFWCENGLCNSDCSAQSSNCSCAADCQNCGTADNETCTCNCEVGWTGAFCSEVSGETPNECHDDDDTDTADSEEGNDDDADGESDDDDDDNEENDEEETVIVLTFRITSIEYTDDLAISTSVEYIALYNSLAEIIQNILTSLENDDGTTRLLEITVVSMIFTEGSVIVNSDINTLSSLSSSDEQEIVDAMVNGVDNGDFGEYMVDTDSFVVAIDDSDEDDNEDSGADVSCAVLLFLIFLSPTISIFTQ